MKILKYLALAVFLMTYSRIMGQVADKAIDVSPLLIGEKSPNAYMMDVGGKGDSLLHILSLKPTVLIFYRGGWCPYCNLQLAELQGIEKDIIQLGYQIVAISPDSRENLTASLEKNKLNYQLLSDADMKLSCAFGIVFRVPDKSKERLATASGGENPGLLPVPSVFVLNQQGEILFEYINPDYKKRLKAGLLLAVLKELKLP